ncbi:MAG: DUF1501 domain-containing protein [Planctomycetaceae bacterium]
MTPELEFGFRQTRRHLMQTAGLGMGCMALQSLLAEEGGSAPGSLSSAARFASGSAPRAKSVIYLHMAGSPSQLELFEHKPELQRLHLQDCPESMLAGRRFAFIKGVPRILAGQFEFQQHGESGQWISELLPQFASVSDRACVIRTMKTEEFNHAPSQLFLQTGNARPGSPAMGSWVTWGLGSMNKNLPGFVVLLSGGKTPDAGKSLWGTGYLPSVYQGVNCRTDGDPVLFLSDPGGMSRRVRRRMLDALDQLNTAELERSGDPETETRMSQYELAYRMQMAVPEVMDLTREPKHILEMYGAQPGYQSPAETAADPRVLYRGDDPTFANNCLLARRLVEAGVRFVQLYDWGWDHHGSSPGESIDETLPIKCQAADRPIAALIRDLEHRGLLDETLYVWGGEFGRTPMLQNNVRSEIRKGFVGRDHHPDAFTMWLAGGGIKGGLSWGRTDDFGYEAIENPTSDRHLQATILYALGLDPYRFSYLYQGLENRLIGPTEEGRVLHDILA